MKKNKYGPHLVFALISAVFSFNASGSILCFKRSVGPRSGRQLVMKMRDSLNRDLDEYIADKTLLTMFLNTGINIKGVLNGVLKNKEGEIYYLKFSGPTVLLERNEVIPGHGIDYHSSGFGTPVGKILIEGREFSLGYVTAENQLPSLGLHKGKVATLRYKSGVTVEGVFTGARFSGDGVLQILTFEKATVTDTNNGDVLFSPSWGTFDMAVSEGVLTVNYWLTKRS